MEKLISCIIPLYNKEKTIERAIKSVLNQGYENFELIIVNDGSTDSSAEIVAKFNDQRVKLINQENKGVSAARNTGIKTSKGGIIAFLDADDLWLANHLSDIHKISKEFPEASIFSTNFKIMLKNGVVESSKIRGISNDKRIVKVESYIKSCTLTGGHLTGPINSSNVAFKRKVFLNIEGFKEGLSNNEDLDLWLRAAQLYEIGFTWNVSCEIDRSLIQIRPLKTFDYHDNYIILSGRKLLNEGGKDLRERFWLIEYINKKKIEFAKNLIFHRRKKKALLVLASTFTVISLYRQIYVLCLVAMPNNLISSLREIKNKKKK